MFVVEEVGIQGWLQIIVDNIKKGNWDIVGKTISEKLNSAFQLIGKKELGLDLGKKINSVIDKDSKTKNDVSYIEDKLN